MKIGIKSFRSSKRMIELLKQKQREDNMLTSRKMSELQKQADDYTRSIADSIGRLIEIVFEFRANKR